MMSLKGLLPDEWTPVCDALPKDGMPVLLFCIMKVHDYYVERILEGAYSGRSWSIYTDDPVGSEYQFNDSRFRVIAWRDSIDCGNLEFDYEEAFKSAII